MIGKRAVTHPSLALDCQMKRFHGSCAVSPEINLRDG